MRCTVVVFLTLTAFTPTAAARPKVAIIDTRQAILATRDGHAAQMALEDRFRGAAQALEAQAPADPIAVGRQREDLQRRIQAEQIKVLQDLGKKMSAVIGNYAERKHYEAVLDVSDANSPVMWFKKANEITKQIVAEYDRMYSSKGQGAAARLMQH
jgi:Skp family chaperone for outer membrane proteins